MDHIRGGYLGLCIGDALGAVSNSDIDFQNYTGKLDRSLFLGARYYGSKYGPPGQVTDISTMVTCLLYRLRENRTWIQDDIISSYLDWANNYSYFLQPNMKKLFVGISTISGFRSRWTKLTSDGTLIGSQSNGSLHRVFAFLILSDTTGIIPDTYLTHPNDVNCEASCIYFSILRAIYSKQSIENVLTPLLKNCQSVDLRYAIEQGWRSEIRPIQQQPNWIVNGIYFAIRTWVFLLSGKSFSEILDWTIRCRGDTSSNAAIAGTIIGLYLGESKLRADSYGETLIRSVLESDPNRGTLPYDKKYHPKAGLALLT